MSINITTAKATAIANAKANIKSAMSSAFGEDESTYDEFAGILADGIGEAIDAALAEVKNNADVVGVASGVDVVAGGVD